MVTTASPASPSLVIGLSPHNLHLRPRLHHEVDVWVAPVAEVVIHAGGVAEVVRRALGDQGEGLQPGVRAGFPHLEAVEGGGLQGGHTY